MTTTTERTTEETAAMLERLTDELAASVGEVLSRCDLGEMVARAGVYVHHVPADVFNLLPGSRWQGRDTSACEIRSGSVHVTFFRGA